MIKNKAVIQTIHWCESQPFFVHVLHILVVLIKKEKYFHMANNNSCIVKPEKE